MSKLSTIVHLLNNGFTEEQVTAMMEAAYSMQQPAQAQMIQQPAQAQLIQQPAQAQMIQQPVQAQLIQQPVQAQTIQPDPYATMNSKLDNIMGAVRAGAVMASAQPKQETADDVLGLMYANIIPPDGGVN